MALTLSILATAGLVMIVFHYWKQLEVSKRPDLEVRKEFLWWAGKGIGLPVLVWGLINAGFCPGIPILLRPIALAQAAGGNWLTPFSHALAVAFFIIGCYWAGISAVWLLYAFYRVPENRQEFRGVVLFWICALAPFGAGFLWLAGVAGTGLTFLMWLMPVAHIAACRGRTGVVPPMYSKAIGLLKMGKFNQAEWALIQELEKCENDFEGWMMLAELYAMHFHDMAVAERTIYDICCQPETNASQICQAIYKLSEWHLKIGEDPDSARRVLEVICTKWPGTHLEKMARYRIQQIPASREDLVRQREGSPIPLPALQESAIEAQPEALSRQGKEEAVQLANRCVEKLKIDPNNPAAREEFARLLAERLEKAEVGIEQLQLLLEMKGQPAPKRAEWLCLVAAWHFRYRRDNESGKKVLQQLIQEYPESVEAFTAQRRLSLIEIEERMKRSRAATVKMTNDQQMPNFQ